jgi:ribose 5-phosphate isomerase B
MRVHIGSDHAGFELKNHLREWLTEQDYDVADHGPQVYRPDDDYPPYCLRTARAVAGDPGSLGLVIGGSGNGEQMAANKVAGIRAALCNELYTARLSREHNDANVLAIGGRVVAEGLADEIVGLWLDTAFEGGRHQRRIDQIAAAERT